MFLVEHIMLREPELRDVRPLSLSEHIEVEASNLFLLGCDTAIPVL